MRLPKGVQRVRKRLKDGSYAVYYYWRATRQKLPSPEDPGFASAVEQARKPVLRTDAESDTFGALVRDYRLSQQFRSMQPKTRKAYERALERLRGMESVRVAEIRRRDILVLRDGLAASAPQAANQLTWVLGVLMKFAVEREWRETNPCAGIGRIKGGSHERWPEEAIKYALANLPEPFRRAVILGLYTGQRGGDCCAMRWDQYDGTAIAVVQQKTGARLWVPVHRTLKAELDLWERSAETILTNSLGRPWTPGSFATRFSRVTDGHGPLEGLVFHGLRKAAAARLAEAGCSSKEIAAITGHATLDMVELYTKEADQKRLAKRAMRRLELVSDRAVNRRKPER